MLRHELPTINDDQQLEEFGIYTTASKDGGSSSLSRQDFRSTQVEELDEYPTDGAFTSTVLAAIENGTGASLRISWAGRPQAADYVFARRPSQPDFLIDPVAANDVLQVSRYRETALANGNRHGMDKHNLSVLRGTLARTGFKVISMSELERPMRLSGDVFMTPPWRDEELDRNPFMLTYEDFIRYSRKLRMDEWFAHRAFRLVAIGLLDSCKASSDDSHRFADEFLSGSKYIDGAVGVFSLDLPAAHEEVVVRWHEIAESDTKLSFLKSKWSDDGELDLSDRHKVFQLAQTAVLDKIPRRWLGPSGRLVPPLLERDFDF